MANKNRILISFLGVAIGVIGILIGYAINNYVILNAPLKCIKITCNADITQKGLPTLYVAGQSEPKINFQRAYKFSRINDSVFGVQLDDSLKTRAFRFYFEYPGEKVEIKNIDLITTSKSYHIDLNQKFNLVKLKNAQIKDQLVLEIEELNGYFDSPKHFLYPTDFYESYKLILSVLAIIILLTVVVFNLKEINLKSVTLSDITLSFLIFSIFLPAPIYNIALIITAVVNIRKVHWRKVVEQRINLIVIAFFLLYLLNNLFISEEGYRNMSTIDRFLPLLIIPIIIPSIASRKLLGLFPISAIALGFGMLITSVFDVYIHNNLIFLSFDNFSKNLHPVYYSYLLFFSIFYVHHHYQGKLKLVIQLLLFGFLVFSGSKLVLLFTIVMFLITIMKSKKALLGFGVLALVIILFAPLTNRFKTVFKTEDLSIIKEIHIDNDNDERINGLTLRVILWRETIATMQGVDYLIGNGVTKTTNRQLQERLVALGLEKHQKYNPHNQYIDTFWRTGSIGLLLLLLIPIYSLIWAIKSKEVVLIQFSLLMLVAMITESIFGRVNGVYFFSLVIILLINSRPIDENSHNRN